MAGRAAALALLAAALAAPLRAAPEPPVPMPGPAVGSARGTADTPARTLAEAEARHAQALQRCRRAAVAAVRAECRREADRVLAQDRARLARRGGLP